MFVIKITCPWSLILLNAGEGGERISQADTLDFSLTDDTTGASQRRRTGIPFTAAGGRIEMHYRVFGEQIAVGIELEVVAGFVE